MKPSTALLVVLSFARVAAADDMRAPSDVRFPVYVGGAYSGVHHAGALHLGLEGAFVGAELLHGVRPTLALGFDGARAEDTPITRPDDQGAPKTEGFTRSTFHVVTGVGALLGASDGVAVHLAIAPGATLSNVPGARAGESLATVGFGVHGRVELIPFHLDFRVMLDRKLARVLLSSLSVCLVVGMDWVEAPNATKGAYVGGAFGLDLVPLVLGPLVRAQGRGTRE